MKKSVSKSRTSSSRRSRRIVVLTAPSGTGKSSVARRLLDAVPELSFSVSVTTRRRRPGERDGVDYYFVTNAEFQRFVKKGDLLEYEEVYPGRFYGTLRSEVEKRSYEHPVLLDVEVKGAMNVKKAFPRDSFVIFLQPPSLMELEHRLRKRGTDDEKSIADRLLRAKEELSYADRFDAVVVNDDLDRATHETLHLVHTFLGQAADTGERSHGQID